MFPFQALLAEQRELGLIVSVLIGFAFGFVLERAGFGRADKLAAQFYLDDLTVFKVMFTAILTAMLGVQLAAGLGLTELTTISESAASETYLWPMLIGGLLLGMGFIISGYCPGTSLVAAASGHLDGLMTVVGVVIGSVLFNESYRWLAPLHESGYRGYFWLHQWLGISPAVLAVAITFLALAAFFGAEWVERHVVLDPGEEGETREHFPSASPGPRRHPLAVFISGPRRRAFTVLVGMCVLVLITLGLSHPPRATTLAQPQIISQRELARRVLDEPWLLRILDLRDSRACAKQRLPGAECTPPAMLERLGLGASVGHRDLVLVGEKGLGLDSVPKAARAFPGRVFVLEGGFQGWMAYALTKPEAPPAKAPSSVQQAYRFRAGLWSVMTGIKAPPPQPSGTPPVVAPRKKKSGGCSS